MQWSPQQEHALSEITKWLQSDSSPQLFRLFGYAGTGKTTLITEIANIARGEVLFMAYTGKAALIMQKKGCYGASTIHSAIYRAIEDKETGKIEYVLNMDSKVASCSLVIIDEVSMVNQEIGEDLLQFGKKILIIGDPFQLPPVSGEGYFTSGKPDVMLTEIHRQAKDNPIIRLSIDIRDGKNLALQQYDECSVLSRRDAKGAEFRQNLLTCDQVLCGMNKTRVNLNNAIRIQSGIANMDDPHEPKISDKLICIKNNRKKGILNGGLWRVNSAFESSTFVMSLSSLDELGHADIDVNVPREFFEGTEETLNWKYRKKIDEFTFGYALTVHKSQGSQWGNVVIIDESPVFREHASRHLYTGVTRAAEKVTIYI